jgi:hypothetical protein
MPLVTPPLGNMAYPLLEFLDAKQESRTGITRYNQGLDANSLNKTASGINTITGYAQQRQELIARNAGEMLVAGIFKSILELICKHQQEPRIIRLRNKWVPMDPREWSDQMDVTVTVGLGTGNKDQQLGHLMMILQTEQAAMQQLGPGNPLVDLGNIYNTLEKICENAGLKTAEPYFSDPSSAEASAGGPALAPAGGPSGSPPNPRDIAAQGKAQAEMVRAQNEPAMAEQQAMLDMLGRLLATKIQAGASVERARIKAGMDLAGSLADNLREIFGDAQMGGGPGMPGAAAPLPAEPPAQSMGNA